MDNRKVVIQQIPVEDKTFEVIRDTFNRYYLIQQKHIQNLHDLGNDINLLNAFANDSAKFNLPGKGYFSDFENSPLMADLLAGVNQAEIKNEIDLLTQEMKQSEISDSTFKTVSAAVYPINSNLAFSTSYIDLLSRKEALTVLLQQKKLKPQSYFYTPVGENQHHLRPEHKIKLEAVLAVLTDEIIALVSKRTTGSGPALLTALARYNAVKLSLQENRLVILKCFSNEESLVTGANDNDIRILKNFADESFLYYFRVLNNFFNETGFSPLDLHLLEDAANRNNEISRGFTGGVPLRMSFDKLLPVKPEETATGTPVSLDAGNIRLLLKNKTITRQKYYDTLKSVYNYDLFKKNCVTEIFRTISTSMNHNPAGGALAMGGYISPDDFFLFVPFISSKKVKKTYHVKETVNMLSYRISRLNELKQKKNKFLVELKESNTFTSGIYHFNSEDSFFIFFTDNHPLLRPVYGLFNIGAGIMQTSYGILTAPFDRGDQLGKGLKGIFFSLPELVFLNIRKGTFQFVKIENLPEKDSIK